MAKLKKDNPDQIPVGDVVTPAEEGEIIDERWYVEEYFPTRIDPFTGQQVLESWNRNYAEPYETEAEANSYIAKHVPDYEGGKFRKAHEVLREVTIKSIQWGPAS